MRKSIIFGLDQSFGQNSLKFFEFLDRVFARIFQKWIDEKKKLVLFFIQHHLGHHQLNQSLFSFGLGKSTLQMAAGLEVSKGVASSVARHICDGMENGVLDITTDALSDNFGSFLKKDPKVIAALRKAFAR